MNLPGSAGESSKRQENGDATEPDRPLKKARFAWEVKGKSHLRNEMSDVKPSTVDSERAGSSSEGNTEQNLEILGDYLLKQDFNAINSLTDNTLLSSSNMSTEKLSYPRYVSSFESSTVSESSSSNDERTPIAKSVVYTNKDVEDQCIAQWQARQMAKCFVDNTINRVLDSWMIAPLPTDTVNRVLALDAAEFINNMPGDNSIENEAILMAISAHGLQNSSSNSNTNERLQNSNNDLFLSPPSSPLLSDDEISPESNLKEENRMDERSSNELECSWTYSNNEKQDNEAALAFYPESSSSSYQCLSESDNINSSNIEYDGDENVSSNDDIVNNYDFLDAAVSFAIQYKGLTSYGMDYG